MFHSNATLAFPSFVVTKLVWPLLAKISPQYNEEARLFSESVTLAEKNKACWLLRLKDERVAKGIIEFIGAIAQFM